MSNSKVKTLEILTIKVHYYYQLCYILTYYIPTAVVTPLVYITATCIFILDNFKSGF